MTIHHLRPTDWSIIEYVLYRETVDGYQIRMVFGSTTCNRDEKSYKNEVIGFNVYKSEMDSRRNVFVHPAWIDKFERLSHNEDIDQGLCGKYEKGAEQDVINDFALIRLPSPANINLTHLNINTICVSHSKEFRTDFDTRRVVAYAAGFGVKGPVHVPGQTREEEKVTEANAYQPYLSFVKYAVFGYTTTEYYLNVGPLIIPKIDDHTLVAIDLSDDQQRDTHLVGNQLIDNR